MEMKQRLAYEVWNGSGIKVATFQAETDAREWAIQKTIRREDGVAYFLLLELRRHNTFIVAYRNGQPAQR
jgi:hypothetical protein